MLSEKFINALNGVISPNDIKNGFLKVEWTTGGMSGGSCWNDGPHHSVEVEPEPEFEQLDKVLNALCPNITYLQYKSLIKNLISYDHDIRNEYYGNYYNITIIQINLGALESYLVGHNLWQS